MAKVQGDQIPTATGTEEGTPKTAAEDSEYQGDKTGIHLTRPKTDVVDTDAYPERPYKDAVTKPHAEILREAGLLE